MYDRPSLGATFLRVLVAIGCFVAGYEHVSHQADAFHDLVINQVLPLPPGAVRPLGILELVCGVILLLGLAPRLAGLLLLVVAVVSAAHTVRHGDDQLHLIGPAVLALVCLLVIGAGGGRFALLDRIDPARPRRLARE
jgi:uncharacterized membrane protein YphA (DoxX/SURF4 family)